MYLKILTELKKGLYHGLLPCRRISIETMKETAKLSLHSPPRPPPSQEVFFAVVCRGSGAGCDITFTQILYIKYPYYYTPS